MARAVARLPEPWAGDAWQRAECCASLVMSARTSLVINMDRSYEVDRNPPAMVTVTPSCSP